MDSLSLSLHEYLITSKEIFVDRKSSATIIENCIQFIFRKSYAIRLSVYVFI